MADPKKALEILKKYHDTVTPEQYFKDLQAANPGLNLSKFKPKEQKRKLKNRD